MYEQLEVKSRPGIRRITTSEKWLALTFDDGPDDRFTPSVLDILDHYGVPATFFCLGAQVQKYPEVLRSMVQADHTVANHSWSHPYFTKESSSQIEWQVEQTSAIIQETAAVRPLLFRPPYGDLNEEVADQIQGLGYQIILWDVDSVDWSGISGPKIAANVLPNIRSGSILLHHCSASASGTVDALPYLIEVATAMGYRFVKLDELTDTPAYRQWK